MKCLNCENEIPENFKFCPECGSNVSSMSGESGVEGSVGSFKTVVNSDESNGKSIGDDRTVVNSGASNSSGFEKQDLSDRYEIGEVLGKGGFATVYKAVDKKLSRTVAVKKLRTSVADDVTVNRFRREALSIANLNHKNIVQVYDVGEDSSSGELFIVMEYVDGGTLSEFLKDQGKLLLKDALPIFRGIGQGLSYAHRKNLVHRDIKPSNILLTADNEPKIVDFGLAQAGRDSELSMSGYGMGTPYYMPPEQRRDAKSVNHTADIYALGKILYQMVTGEIPDALDPSVIPPPSELADIIFKCTKPKPEDRFFSVDDLLRDLDTISSEKTAPVGKHRQALHGENVCPSCGIANEKDSRFCEACGTGLFMECPECGQENVVSTKYCNSCGTNIQNFLLAEEVLSKMNKYASEAKWSRVVKEYELFDSKSGLPGENGQALNNSIETVYSETVDKIEYLEKLKSHYTEINQAYVDEDWQRVINSIASIDLKQLYIGGEADELVEKIKNIFFKTVDNIMEVVSAAEANFNWDEVINLLEGVMNVSFFEIPDKVKKAYSNAGDHSMEVKQLEQKVYDNSNVLASGAFKKSQGVALCDTLLEDINYLQKISHIPDQWIDFKKQVEEKKRKMVVKTSKTIKIAVISAVSVLIFLIIIIVTVIANKNARKEKYFDYVKAELTTADNYYEEGKYQNSIETLDGISVRIDLCEYETFELLDRKEELLSNAMFELGIECEKNKNITKAVTLYRKSAELGNAHAKVLLGLLYWTAELGGGVTIDLLPVAAGSFMMGSNDSDAYDSEKPVHQVTISKPFWIGKYEVTQNEYEQIMGKNPSYFKGSNNPVECVSWNDAMEFCKKLTEKERSAGRLPSGYKYTLPTEAQWEFAARGGNKSKGYKYSGSDNLDSVGWYDGNSGKNTHEVGQKQPNELGLYDMSGNVWEWCSDWYDSDYYDGGSMTDPVGASTGSYRVIRGGSWNDYARSCRAAVRDGNTPAYTSLNLGFRLCLQTD